MNSRAAPAAALGVLCWVLSGCASAPRGPELPADAAERFAFRNPDDGWGPGLGPRDQRRLHEAAELLRAGDLERAEEAFRARTPAPYRLGLVYVDLARDRREEARAELERLLKVSPKWLAALEARADLDAVEGRLREAMDGYQAMLRVARDDARGARRAGEVREALVKERAAQAARALEQKDVDGARRLALSLLEIAPQSPAGFRLLADAAESAGKHEDAYAWAAKAHALDTASAEDASRLAQLAMQTRRYGEALSLYEDLARRDRAYAGRAEAARLEFKLQNLPEAARRAALSARLTRAQLASLLWALVPQVRDAVVGNPEVAVDALDRSDRAAIVRAIALGFLTVSKETHRVGADAPVLRSDLPPLLNRLAGLVARGRPIPECLADPSVRALAECGILSDTNTRTVSGREGTAAIEATARQVREGGP